MREWLILESHENIRVLHIIACPIDFNLLRDLAQQLGGNSQNVAVLESYSIFDLFSKIYGRLELYHC